MVGLLSMCIASNPSPFFLIIIYHVFMLKIQSIIKWTVYCRFDCSWICFFPHVILVMWMFALAFGISLLIGTRLFTVLAYWLNIIVAFRIGRHFSHEINIPLILDLAFFFFLFLFLLILTCSAFSSLLFHFQLRFSFVTLSLEFLYDICLSKLVVQDHVEEIIQA